MDTQQMSSPTAPEISSFVTRATNVFTAPSDLFTEVASAPAQRSSWLMPYIITMLVSALFTVTLFTNPTFRDQMFEQQRAEFQKKVEKGEMTQEQSERAQEFMQSSSMVMIFGVAGSVVVTSIMVFGAALVLWLVLKTMLKTNHKYGKALELYGLASLIGVLGVIVTIILIHLFDTIHASPGGVLLVLGSYNHDSFVHKLLASITVFGLWQTTVIGIGLAKLSGKPTADGMKISFVLWVLLVLIFAATGRGIL